MVARGGFLSGALLFTHGGLAAWSQQALVVERVNIPFQLACAPMLFGRLTPIIVTSLGALDPHDEPILRPAQFSTQRVENVLGGIGQVELPEVPHVGFRKAPTELRRQLARHVSDQLLSVGGA